MADSTDNATTDAAPKLMLSCTYLEQILTSYIIKHVKSHFYI